MILNVKPGMVEVKVHQTRKGPETLTESQVHEATKLHHRKNQLQQNKRRRREIKIHNKNITAEDNIHNRCPYGEGV